VPGVSAKVSAIRLQRMSQNSVACAKNNHTKLFHIEKKSSFRMAYVLLTLFETKPGIGKWHKKTIWTWT
jgi:hypothetical protein